ncbi:MAG: metal-dependent hydrolase [Patescibacteria group bacterium]
MKFYKIIAGALAGFLDFSAGAFIVYLGSIFSDYQIGIPSYILGGILGILPDFDILYIMFSKKTTFDHHQFITHKPVPMSLLFLMLGYFLGGVFWAIIASLCLLWHYLHDTEYILGGGGIAWLWPLSKLYYSPWRIVSPEKSLMAEHKNHEKWLEEIWCKPSKTSVIEIFLGLILLLIIAQKGLNNWRIGAFFIIVIWLFLLFLWGDNNDNSESK